jgi:uncharacterized protein YecE (DUF72 family)
MGIQGLGGHCVPQTKPRGFDPVAYLARYFDTIEINSSFYGPPRRMAAKAWAEHSGANPRFRFTAKVYKAFTYDRKASQTDRLLGFAQDGRAALAAANRFGSFINRNRVASRIPLDGKPAPVE